MKENEYNGEAANQFIESKLNKLSTDPDKWETLYEDPETGERWLLDYPQSEYHGGGSPRLRRLPLSDET